MTLTRESKSHEPLRAEKGREISTVIIASLPGYPIPEVTRIGQSPRAWKNAIVAYFDTNGSSSELN